MKKQNVVPREFRRRHLFMSVEEVTRRTADMFKHAQTNEKLKNALIIF